MFHNHPALVQTLLDDHLHRLRDHHGLPAEFIDLPLRDTPRTSSRAARRAQRRVAH